MLYLLIAFAGFRLVSAPRETQGRMSAINLFFLQLLLNALWSVAFFGLRSPQMGLVVIIALVVVLMALVGLAWRVERTASLALLPYLLWVGFAAALNFEIWRLN